MRMSPKWTLAKYSP